MLCSVAPQYGGSRYTAIIYKIILPEKGDRNLHVNASFNPSFTFRALDLALEERAGLAFMHSHPSDGWQPMSPPDVAAERETASTAQTAKLPLVGLTIGTDGYWSARFWEKEKTIERYWCRKVRVVGKESYRLYYNDHIAPPRGRRNVQRRTFDTWGEKHQNNLARLKVGVVGLGSVGGIVAEAMARIGIGEIVLIDPDRIKEHNLDRLIYGKTRSLGVYGRFLSSLFIQSLRGKMRGISKYKLMAKFIKFLYGKVSDIGKYKVSVASIFIEEHATANKFKVTALPLTIQNQAAYDVALDCDFLFSCVDRPVARDVLNFIALSNLIPVVDGGVAVDITPDGGFLAHWRSQLVTPYHQCMRCSEQYTTSDVTLELDGSLDDPSYIRNLPKEKRNGNQNVFPFCLSVASMEVNMMIRYIVFQGWKPKVHLQDYQFRDADIDTSAEICSQACVFQEKRIAMGDKCMPRHIQSSAPQPKKNFWMSWLTKLFSKQF